MKIRVLSLIALLSLYPVGADASIITYVADLNGPSESPVNASPGTGHATVIVDNVANTMELFVDFAGLLGITTASHIHCCTTVAGIGTAGVATTTPTFAGFPLGVTAGTYHNTLNLLLASSYNPAFVTANGGTPASAEAVLLAGLAADKSYLNIHTSAFPGGEIRGFLVPAAVPEPATLSLFGLGLAASALRKRRARKDA
jgi:hypothetical protein